LAGQGKGGLPPGHLLKLNNTALKSGQVKAVKVLLKREYLRWPKAQEVLVLRW